MPSELAMGYTNYNKIENGIHETSVTELQKLAGLFNMTVDQILNTDGDIPGEIMEDKSSIEQMFLIKQLDKDDRILVFKIIDTMLTKKGLKTFFKIMWLCYKTQKPQYSEAFDLRIK